MINQYSKRIALPAAANYRFGAVTYQVRAHFDAEKPMLPDKIKQLLSAEVKNHSNDSFANSQRDHVKCFRNIAYLAARKEK